MYTKDLRSLLQLLDVSDQSGVLRITREGDSWQAQIHLHRGSVQMCEIQTQDSKHLLQGQQALHWLAALGSLSYTFEEFSEQPATPTHALSEFSPIVHTSARAVTRSSYVQHSPAAHEALGPLVPQRLVSSLDRSWPRDATRIFALIDGRRTVDSLAHILRRDPEALLPILQHLARKGCVRMH